MVSLKDVETYYDDFIKVLINHLGCERITKVKSFVRNNLSEDDFVLDIGCGLGETSRAAAEIAYTVIGCDISEKNILWAGEHTYGDNVTYVHSDALALLSNFNFIGVVMLLDVVEHFLPEERPKILAEVNRIADKILVNIPKAEVLRDLKGSDRLQLVDEPVEIEELEVAFCDFKLSERTDWNDYVFLVFDRRVGY